MFLVLGLNDAKVEVTRRFYERLGYGFAPEKHANGLPHHSTQLADMVVEIYPAIKGLPQGEGLFVGIEVNAPATVTTELIENYGGGETDPPTPVTKSGIATLRDPNGVLVRLFPKP